jgi:hypothetical protein
MELQPQYLSKLREQLNNYFSLSELRTICFDLGVDYSNPATFVNSQFRPTA